LDECKLLEYLRKLRRSDQPTALDELVEKGCCRSMLITAAHAVVTVESLRASQRNAFIALGFSEKTLLARAKRFRKDADFLRELADQTLLSPLGHPPGKLLAVDLPRMLERAATLFEAWPPPKLFHRLREMPIAALKQYVRKRTGKPHYAEIADLIDAARCACGLGSDQEPVSVDVVRHRGKGVSREDVEGFLDGYVQQVSTALAHLKSMRSLKT
jgi:DNA-directed RNA polymerase subunit N (RpoN/RPB10)